MPIQVLPPQLANQIAAGEVVERPASVVKELVENSLDAGATRIDIDIERAGARLIRIRDNGCGIGKDELSLALARHATSKIVTLDDLESITSLGFRGEALASISSVSRLTLTSRTEAQNEAWQAYAEGRDMAVTVKPAAHPQGSTVEVLDLFYNTPARRKFMRTEKTEFAHIDEVVKRIALARFDVTFTLQHNGKPVRQYRAVSQPEQHLRRLGSLCGPAFVQRALAVSWTHGDLAIRGWVVDPRSGGELPEMQYCYVNQRMMRDKLINHAIRQAYQEQLTEGQQPAFVLYLEVDPHQVDVNVHPAKHEVRFHQARLVHDFIYQAVMTVLQQAAKPDLLAATAVDEDGVEIDAPRWQPENRQAAGGNHFSQPASKRDAAPRPVKENVFPATARISQPREPVHKDDRSSYTPPQGDVYQRLLQSTAQSLKVEEPPATLPAKISHNSLPESALDSHSQSFGRVLTVCAPEYALLERGKQLVLLSLPVAERWLKRAQLTPPEEGLRPQPLLIPLKLQITKEESAAFTRHQALLQRSGLEMMVDHQHVTLRAVPLPLRQQNLQKLIPDLLGYLAVQQEVTSDAVAMWFARHIGSDHDVWNISQAIQLLTDVERLCPQLVKSPPSGLLQPVDLQPALAAFKRD